MLTAGEEAYDEVVKLEEAVKLPSSIKNSDVLDALNGTITAIQDHLYYEFRVNRNLRGSYAEDVDANAEALLVRDRDSWHERLEEVIGDARCFHCRFLEEDHPEGRCLFAPTVFVATLDVESAIREAGPDAVLPEGYWDGGELAGVLLRRRYLELFPKATAEHMDEYL